MTTMTRSFVAVRPIRETATGELARRLLPADAFVDAPLPERRAGAGSMRECLAASRGHGEEPAVRVQRRRAKVLVLAVLAGVPLPGDLQRVEVGRR